MDAHSITAEAFKLYGDDPLPYQDPWEFEQLLHLLIPRRPESVLEIGTWRGATAQGFALLESVQQVVTICPNVCEYEHNKPLLSPKIVFIVGYSQEPHVHKEAAEHGPYDVLFIDGDHALERAKFDFEMYGPLVRSGGTVIFHDVAFTNPHGTVVEYWNSQKYKYEHFIEIITPMANGTGLGVGMIINFQGIK